MVGERLVEGEWTVIGRWLNGDWTMNGRWMDGEWTVNGRWLDGESGVLYAENDSLDGERTVKVVFYTMKMIV